MPRPSHAPVVVLGVTELPEKRPVYDLEVEGVPEFYVSGILVHNCMNALEYGATRLFFRATAKKKDSERRLEGYRSQASSRRYR